MGTAAEEMSSGTKVDPVFLLQQKLPGLKILVTSSWQTESNPPTPVYTARLELAGRWFESEATSRKEAKCELSRKVLKEVYGVEPGGNGGGQKGGEAMEQELADRCSTQSALSPSSTTFNLPLLSSSSIVSGWPTW